MSDFVALQAKLAALFGPSGCEGSVASFIKEYATPYSDDITVDTLGNLIVHKKGNGKKIMVTAHMDSIGIIVTRIEKSGLLKFCSAGAARYVSNYSSTQIIFENGTRGVIYGEASSDISKPNSNLYIDIGASSDEIAKENVRIGDRAVYQPNTFSQNGKLFSNYLDDRIGCVVLMEALSKLKNSENDIYFVFSVQEEVGFRGIKTATQLINPDFAITVDVTPTSDMPCSESNGNTELGKGVAIKVADCTVICNSKFVQQLENIAKTSNIIYQLEIMHNGTDAGAIQGVGSGIYVGGIGIPTRYVHSAIEVADISDIEACIEMIVKVAGQFKM